MKISEKGIKLLHQREGLRLSPYLDTVGVATIAFAQAIRFIAQKESSIDFKYVASKTKRDARVRAKHRKHDQKYWSLSSGYQPWFDFNCRCTYIYFQTKREAELAGYTKRA